MKTKASTRRPVLPLSRRQKPDNPEQFERFIEAARKIGMDESPEVLDRVFDQVVRAPKKSS
jgi:hypothetical protein